MSERERRRRDRREETADRARPVVPGDEHHPGGTEPEHPLLGLQGLVGNSAVEALLHADEERIPAGLRGDMERSFGRSFDDVRMHQGHGVDQVADQLDAAAFTVGDDVYLHSSAPDPDTPEGKVVIGEELAHVVQGAGAQEIREVAPPDSGIEREAHAARDAVARGATVSVDPRPDAGTALTRFQWSALGEMVGSLFGGTTEEPAPPTLTEQQKLQVGATAIPTLEWATGVVARTDDVPALVRRVNGAAQVVDGIGAPEPFASQLGAASQLMRDGSTLLWSNLLGPAKSLGLARSAFDYAKRQAEAVAARVRRPDPALPDAPVDADELTPAQASYLRNGIIDPLGEAIMQLDDVRSEAGEGAPSPDALRDVVGANRHLSSAIRAADAPAAHRPTLERAAEAVNRAILQVSASALTDDQARAATKGMWLSALGTLRVLTARSSLGALGALAAGAAAAIGGTAGAAGSSAATEETD